MKKNKTKTFPCIVMIGAARCVHGGVSAVVNSYYQAGLDRQVSLIYIGTMVDGSKFRKLLTALKAYLHFCMVLPRMDILHVNMAADASFYRKRIFINTAAFFHKKILIHQHGGDFQGFYYDRTAPKGRAGICRTLNKAQVFVVLSSQWAEFFASLVEGNKITVLQNAVYLPADGKQDYAGRNLLFLGRLCKEKGIGELLTVLPRIAERFPDLKLYLGGTWADPELQKKAEELADQVIYLGWIGSAEKQAYMDTCSIFVLPTYFEGQPMSLLEAMAAGMAVLTTAVGGIPQIIDNGVHGILVAPQDPKSLAEGLTALLEDEESRRRYGRAARNRAEEDYDIAQRVAQLCSIYNNILK